MDLKTKKKKHLKTWIKSFQKQYFVRNIQYSRNSNIVRYTFLILDKNRLQNYTVTPATK